MHFNVNFNVFFKLIKVHLLVSELQIYVMFGTFISYGLQFSRLLNTREQMSPYSNTTRTCPYCILFQMSGITG